MPNKANIEIGSKFNKWTILEIDEILSKKRGTQCCLVRCDCGKESKTQYAHIFHGRSKMCRSCSKKNDFIGKEFGKWRVISKSDTHNRKWLCECSCGNQCEVFDQHLRKGSSTQCRQCSGSAPIILDIGQKFNKLTVVENISNNRGNYVICECECGRLTHKTTAWMLMNDYIKQCKNCVGWDGYEEISGTWFNNYKKGAILRGLTFNIDKEFVWNIYIQQNKKCALTNIPIKFVRNHSIQYRHQTASIDRIDSNIGYEENNIQLIHKKLNFMKSNTNQDDFIDLCNLVALKHNRIIDIENFKYEDKVILSKVKND